MRHRSVLALFLLVAPGMVRAQDSPESLLPAGAQVYIRWDGIDAHRAAYAGSALGQMLKGDTGTFLTTLYRQLEDGAAMALAMDQVLRGESPAKLKKLQDEARSATRLVPLLGQKGFLLAAEIRSLEPPRAQVTLVVPDAGPAAASLFAVPRLAAGLARAGVEESTVHGRAVAALNLDGVHLAWWAEGKHAVIALGTDKVEDMVGALKPGSGPRLVDNPLFKRVKGFDRFATVARAFVDVQALVKVGAGRSKEVKRLLDDLGLDGVKSLVAYSGFEGRAERGLWELELSGPRRGVLSLLQGKPFTLADVPPLPPDVGSWSMTNFDPGALYDVGLQAAEDVMRILSPDDVPKIHALLKTANNVLGLDVRKDLLGALGDQFVEYNSPGDGPLTLGNTVLVRVKDADRVHAALAQAIKALASAGGTEVKLKKRMYRGVEMRMVNVRQQGFIFVPSYAIVNGWLAVSLFPQPVEAFIARSRGELQAWKPAPQVEESLRKLPGKFVSISYSDPRPSVKQLMSIAPLVGGIVANLNQEFNFDVGSLPNAQEVTRHLFPNVSVTTDDGNMLRSESLGSLSLPLDVAGLDTYALFFAFAAFAGAAF